MVWFLSLLGRLAQQTALRNIRIEGRDGGVALDVWAGGGTIEDLELHGAQYGLLLADSQYLFKNIRISGAKIAGVSLHNTMNTVFLGLHVSSTPTGFRWPSIAQGGMVSFIDCSFRNISSGTAIFSPVSDSSRAASAPEEQQYGAVILG